MLVLILILLAGLSNASTQLSLTIKYTGFEKKITYPADVALNLVKAEDMEISLQLTEAGRALQPAQAVIHFQPTNGQSLFFAFAKRKQGLSLFLDFAKDFEPPCDALESTELQFTMKVYVSDPKLPNPVEWRLGKATLAQNGDKVLQQKCASSEARQWERRPEFTHQFKPEPPRAASLVAVATAGVLAVVPNVVLIAMLSRLHLKLAALSHLPFHLLLTAMMGIITFYWLDGLRIFPCLFLLLATGALASRFRPRAQHKLKSG
eukprot:NODE_3853_length_884_cov_597.206077_g3700_i0.p1 GENE.NODE_3853_length_884_cov_597.206077_g3700_i0~~NODE_3853_length_884_cov_597.206077_g3700_i0.p1  ORF type:complete len:263 (-),score=60.22 NODE_3853_length_884_cov_597.206077_g3700_i0:46-834(-)